MTRVQRALRAFTAAGGRGLTVTELVAAMAAEGCDDGGGPQWALVIGWLTLRGKIVPAGYRPFQGNPWPTTVWVTTRQASLLGPALGYALV